MQQKSHEEAGELILCVCRQNFYYFVFCLKLEIIQLILAGLVDGLKRQHNEMLNCYDFGVREFCVLGHVCKRTSETSAVNRMF